MRAASPAVILSVVKWAVWEDVDILSDHRLIVAQFSHHPLDGGNG